jgi:transposase
MLSQNQRTTILELHAKGMSVRQIARALEISRPSVRKVLQANSAEVPPLLRPEKAEPYRQQILELLDSCKGNLVRVREELEACGVPLAYSTLTGFCRRHSIGQQPLVPSGNYDFLPGEEIQHDTSPHEVELGGRLRKVQTASAVLCYSRMLFFAGIEMERAAVGGGLPTSLFRLQGGFTIPPWRRFSKPPYNAVRPHFAGTV